MRAEVGANARARGVIARVTNNLRGTGVSRQSRDVNKNRLVLVQRKSGSLIVDIRHVKVKHPFVLFVAVTVAIIFVLQFPKGSLFVHACALVETQNHTGEQGQFTKRFVVPDKPKPSEEGQGCKNELAR